MLESLALVFLGGLLLGGVCERLRLPRLLGMLLAGVLLGPSICNALDAGLLAISADLRQIALIIILLRAGLNLDLSALKRVGRPAVCMCFVPACLEIIGVLLLAPPLLGLSRVEAAVLGTVLAAVSPAVVVPKMLHLMETGRGVRQGIPQLIMAGASVDDVFVIVLFTACTGLAQGEAISVLSLARIPISILFGLLGGVCAGGIMAALFGRVSLRDSAKGLAMVSVAFLLIALERALTGVVGFSGLLAVMGMGVALQRHQGEIAARLSRKFEKIWVGAEILLFVLVGAAVPVSYALQAGLLPLAVIAGALAFRMLGVWLCLLRTPLTRSERWFCMLAYTPKATVQAAIGSIPMTMGLACGPMVLTTAVLSILITAPLGAAAIDRSAPRWLTKDDSEQRITH